MEGLTITVNSLGYAAELRERFLAPVINDREESLRVKAAIREAQERIREGATKVLSEGLGCWIVVSDAPDASR